MAHNVHIHMVAMVIFVVQKMYIWIIIVSMLLCMMKDLSDKLWEEKVELQRKIPADPHVGVCAGPTPLC